MTWKVSWSQFILLIFIFNPLPTNYGSQISLPAGFQVHQLMRGRGQGGRKEEEWKKPGYFSSASSSSVAFYSSGWFSSVVLVPHQTAFAQFQSLPGNSGFQSLVIRLTFATPALDVVVALYNCSSFGCFTIPCWLLSSFFAYYLCIKIFSI